MSELQHAIIANIDLDTDVFQQLAEALKSEVDPAHLHLVVMGGAQAQPIDHIPKDVEVTLFALHGRQGAKPEFSIYGSRLRDFAGMLQTNFPEVRLAKICLVDTAEHSDQAISDVNYLADCLADIGKTFSSELAAEIFLLNYSSLQDSTPQSVQISQFTSMADSEFLETVLTSFYEVLEKSNQVDFVDPQAPTEDKAMSSGSHLYI